jgi:hypothetical protein
VIIGKLIPAGTGAPANVLARREAERRRAAEALAGGELPAGFGEEYNPFLEATEEAGHDDDAARLSALLAATAAGDDEAADAEYPFNPFATPEPGTPGEEVEPVAAEGEGMEGPETGG